MSRWTVHSSGVAPEEDINDKYHVSMAVGASNIYCFGGPYKDVDRLQVHIFNTVSMRWAKLPDQTGTVVTPSMRFGHSAVLIGHGVYVWGGYWNGDFCEVLFVFDVDTHLWSQPKVCGAAPPGTRNHSACAIGTLMYVYGGFNWDGCSSDIYTLETAEPEPETPTKGKGAVLVPEPIDKEPLPLVWSLVAMEPGTPRPASSWHSATVIGTKMYVFGGRGSQNHVRVFDPAAGCWTSTASADFLPHGRAATFAYGGELYAFGCHHMRSGHAFQDDLWKFNPETSSWRKMEPKGEHPPSLKPRMCCCLLGDRIVVLFGGYRGYDTPADDLYMLDLRPDLKTLSKIAAEQYGLKHAKSARRGKKVDSGQKSEDDKGDWPE